ncbi:hypothetical protein BOTBODRAFT_27748 [Botryobasidium botryosum FD-172 SS1]|uniref:SAM-dependent MTase RsmB/NOP-type domain-containing protein n=1 Tax=Botryobasidium botryosum (strain FD-172 SS1) TaxID=930990 RepID=A0A067N087_BOTB1|nr:hypothetical protein BOTBODRAFT_27748 [Botryobasidium botryosum FD-172 SS1]
MAARIGRGRGGKNKGEGRKGKGKGKGEEPKSESSTAGVSASSTVGENGLKDDGRAPRWITSVDMKNDKYEAYYQAQDIVESEHEWNAMMNSFREPLPTTFRLTGSKTSAQDLNEYIKATHISHLNEVVFEGQKIPPPTQLLWYPDGLAWQLNVAKTVVRKQPEFKKFQNFLVYETEVGNISRQEAVSMIPPLLLDVKPHHIVLDMCAAPGSKTAQIIEALHADGSNPPGVLIANDSDYKRSHMLIHQLSRLPSPSFMVTNVDASIYPSLQVPNENAKGNKKTTTLSFDRILCDVPCSGDGTLRKNLGIWKSWHPGDGNGLHTLQLRILLRGMRMLKPGGRLVYSTCSLNPVENEAVVSAALNILPEFSLLDVSSSLPELQRRPGLSKWKVAADKQITMCDTYESFLSIPRPAGQKVSAKLTETHFPPANAATLNLDRCLRIYPHLQDTGGFFVAVLVKAGTPKEAQPSANQASSSGVFAVKREAEDEPPLEQSSKKVKTEDEAAIPAESADIAVSDIVQSEPLTGGSFNEAPFTFLPVDNPQLTACLQNLKIKSSFPADRLFVRNAEGDALRGMYFCSPVVKQIITHNAHERTRLVNCGVKLFTKQPEGGEGGQVAFRFADSGIALIRSFVDDASTIQCELKDLKRLLESYYPLCDGFVEPFRDIITKKELGSYILEVQPGEWEGVSLRHQLDLPFWKSRASVCLMVDKKAKSALSLRLFGTDITKAAEATSKEREERIEEGTHMTGVVESSAATPTPIDE